MSALPKADVTVRDERGVTRYRLVEGTDRKVQWWWNRDVQMWCTMVVDSHEYQLGDSHYCHANGVAHSVEHFVHQIKAGDFN